MCLNSILWQAKSFFTFGPSFFQKIFKYKSSSNISFNFQINIKHTSAWFVETCFHPYRRTRGKSKKIFKSRQTQKSSFLTQMTVATLVGNFIKIRTFVTPKRSLVSKVVASVCDTFIKKDFLFFLFGLMEDFKFYIMGINLGKEKNK